MNNAWRGKQYLAAVLAAGWGMVAGAAAAGSFQCQTGMVLVDLAPGDRFRLPLAARLKQ